MEILRTTLLGLFFGTFGTTIGGIIGVVINKKSNKFLSFILSFASRINDGSGVFWFNSRGFGNKPNSVCYWRRVDWDRNNDLLWFVGPEKI